MSTTVRCTGKVYGVQSYYEGESESASAGTARAEVVVVDGMGHALAEEPGGEPAPQTAGAGAVDRQAAGWLRAHLRAPAGGPTHAMKAFHAV
jgi:hypothetical protein